MNLKLPATGLRACRVCGRTEFDACIVDGVPCHWVGPDLCSACAGIHDAEDAPAARFVEGRPVLKLRSRIALSALGTCALLGVIVATMTVPL